MICRQFKFSCSSGFFSHDLLYEKGGKAVVVTFSTMSDTPEVVAGKLRMFADQIERMGDGKLSHAEYLGF